MEENSRSGSTSGDTASGSAKVTLQQQPSPSVPRLDSTASHVSTDQPNVPFLPRSGPPSSSRDGGGFMRQFSSRRQLSTLSRGGNMALFEDEAGPGSTPLLSAYLSTFTMPGPLEREKIDTKKKKANLGMLIGVYLPTIQHIFGVLMFLRLSWIVGSAGILESLALVSLCCLCTFLTSISMSAIATNGVVESGGSYFMISRNLGPEFGTAVGILFYLANAVATAMYLIGGVELLLMYIAPMITVGGHEAHDDPSFFGMLINNFRLYGTGLLVIEVILVAVGVRFVQLFAPLTLACVLVSVAAMYAGSIANSVGWNVNATNICMLGEKLLRADAVTPHHTPIEELCNFCIKNETVPLWKAYCDAGVNNTWNCQPYFVANNLTCSAGITGFTKETFFGNLQSKYMEMGESIPGHEADKDTEVYQDIKTYWLELLAIYFPSVTGIMTGSNMSGDLKDPQGTIPIGTIAAQITTSVVYLTLVLVFGGTIRGPLLRDKFGYGLGGAMVVANLAWPHRWVLLGGAFTSTFGAALQCLCSAPRLLQSIAKDDVIPLLRPFSVVNKWGEPWRGLFLTAIISEVAILIGVIEHIAPIVDFFFLMCYAFVNIVCVLHSLLGAPNWRPRFKYYHWTLSLLGALLCFAIMFLTYWYYALVVIILTGLVYKYVEYKGAKKEWGDGIRGLALTTAQYSLLKIEDKEPHPKNWRPQFLVLIKMHGTDTSQSETHKTTNKLLDLTSQLKAGKGLTLVASLLAGNPSNADDALEADQIKIKIMKFMENCRLKGFAKCIIYEPNQMSGSVSTLIQSAGIGGLKPNTVMIGWPRNWNNTATKDDDEYWGFIDKIHRGAALDMCLIVPKGLDEFPDQNKRLSGFMDIWWVLQDGGLLILLSFLLRQHRVWRQCKLRLFAVAQEKDNSVKMKEDLIKMLYQLRIDASVTIVEFSDPEISAYAYERTLRMEERSKLIRDLNLSAKQKKTLPQIIVEQSRVAQDSKVDVEPLEENEENGDVFKLENLKSEEPSVSGSSEKVSTKTSDTPTDADKRVQFTFTASEERSRSMKNLDKRKVKKMHTAVTLNKKIRDYSGEAQLVVLNLPRPPKTKMGLFNYLEYLDALTENLKRVLLIRGSGKEVITIYS